MSTTAPQHRHVLVNFGNRYVAFGASRPSPFAPDHVTEILPRVADESEGAEARIVDSLQVLGFKRQEASTGPDRGIDLVLEDGAGGKILIVTKVSHRNPTSKDLQRDTDELQSIAIADARVELWRFNIERLALSIEWIDNGRLEQVKLPALDVFERTPTGLFRRAQVIERLDAWQRALEDLYSRIADWVATQPRLKIDRSRSVVIAEEMMQKFDVVDRDVPILDVSDEHGVALSLVPRGIWIIGARGRVDLITRKATHMLVLVDKDDALDWHLVDSHDRRKTRTLTEEDLVTFAGEA